MDKITIACVQQRNIISTNQEEFEAQARRFMHLAQAKSAQLVIFPELTGLMLAPPLFSGLKLGFIKRADQGSQPGVGAMRRGVKRLAEAAAGALGGFRGSLDGLLRKRSGALWDVYTETFGRLAREFGMVIVGGSLYLRDYETDTLRHRACVFDVDGQILGYQDKLNLTTDEQELVVAGTDLTVFDSQLGRFGLLIGWDALYPELARLLAMQGAELLVGIAAAPGAAQAQVIRSALALRAEENQVFTVASFLLGPNYLGLTNRDDYLGQSAVLAPISLTDKGSGVLVQVGTNRTEGLISTVLDYEALHNLWQTSSFRPRQQMVLGNLGPVLADLYREGLTLSQAVEQQIAAPAFESVPVPIEAESDEPEVAPPEARETQEEE